MLAFVLNHAAKRHHAFDLFFVRNGHDACFNGNVDVRQAAAFEEPIKIVVVEKELRDELCCACGAQTVL